VQTIYLPGSTPSSEGSASGNRSRLTDVTVGWKTPLAVPSDTFEDMPVRSCTLHIPKGTQSLYKAAGVWRDFGTIKEIAGPVPPTSATDNGSHSDSNSLYIYYNEDILSVNTAVEEDVTVYSLTGSLIHIAHKAAGEANFRIRNIPKGAFIVTGSSGWTKKMLKQS
jgi:hypothetical protein